MMFPIFDQFDVYEIFDDKQMKKPNSMVATLRGKRLEHDGPIRFGGVLRKLEFDSPSKRTHQFYLETLFYTTPIARQLETGQIAHISQPASI